jgi:hypothetical protein
MGLKFFGATAAQNIDNAGEKLLIDGLDISRLNIIKDEHPEQPSFFTTVGAITSAKKIFSEKDCASDKELRVWKHVQAPLVYVEGELADGEDHPNAKSASSFIKFASRPDIPVSIGLSIDGAVLEKQNEGGQIDENGKILSKTAGLAASLTVNPCNPRCKLFMDNDLTKSDLSMPPPARYWKELKKSKQLHSFTESEDGKLFKLHLKLESLKKSLIDYHAGFTAIKCKKCGTGVRFFKSSSTLPNGCQKCRSHFTMDELWKALNA